MQSCCLLYREMNLRCTRPIVTTTRLRVSPYEAFNLASDISTFLRQVVVVVVVVAIVAVVVVVAAIVVVVVVVVVVAVAVAVAVVE
jgi:hypothetical protein